VDILVNNAGGAQTKSIKRWSENEFDDVLALNLGSVWRLSRAASVPMLAQGKGAIVNISSGASLAAAWSRKGVRVNAIACGAVRAATLMDEADKVGLDESMLAMSNGVGRLGEPDEIGYGVLFFASDASSFCSGQTLYMHGVPGPAGV
jgi:NAD(P)-dependent dehydrogenase (short-subunit alcohol dehydrogenase family)